MEKDIKLLGSILFAFATLCSTSATKAYAMQDYESGLAMYNQKNYSAAAEYFARAAAHNPGNSSAQYYAGYSYYMAGKRTEAIAAFYKLVEQNPNKKEADLARKVLSQIDPHFNDHKSNLPSTAKTTAPSPGTKATISELLNKLIVVVPPKGKIPATTPAFAATIKSGLSSVPQPILAFMTDNDAHVTLTPSVVEFDYRIQNTQPRGWNEGSSWKDSPALTYGSNVVVSQYRLDARTENYIDTMNADEIGVVRHELGHALDYCLSNASTENNFKHAYFLDAAEVPEEYRAKLGYYLQNGDAGPQETFAELCCYEFGGETGSRKESCELVHQYFPLAGAQLAKSLKRIGVN